MKLTAMKPQSNERCIDCANYVEGDICHICEFIPKQKTTNADRIRHMSDEELAYEISEKIDCCVCKSMHNTEEAKCPCRPNQACVDFWLDWLRQEALDG